MINRELETAYHALAAAIENTLREPGCEEDIAIQSLELYMDLIARIVPSQEDFLVMGGSCGVALDSRPSTPQEVVEIIARIRAEHMSRREQEPALIN